MASSILTSARHGAYVAIGLYVAMVLVVSVAAQIQRSPQAPVQLAYPAIEFEHRSHSVSAEHALDAGVAQS